MSSRRMMHVVPTDAVLKSAPMRRLCSSRFERTARHKGWQRIAILNSTDVAGADGLRQLQVVVGSPEMSGMSIVAEEHFVASDVNVAPPAGAKSVDLGSLTRNGKDTAGQVHASGLKPVQAAATFPVVAPDRLVGLPRQDVRLVGKSDSKAALVVYGHGLGAIVVVERAGAAGNSGAMGSLPQVSLNGVTAHELATQLGTALTWKRGEVTYVLAGSVPPAAAEAAARALG